MRNPTPSLLPFLFLLFAFAFSSISNLKSEISNLRRLRLCFRRFLNLKFQISAPSPSNPRLQQLPAKSNPRTPATPQDQQHPAFFPQPLQPRKPRFRVRTHTLERKPSPRAISDFGGDSLVRAGGTPEVPGIVARAEDCVRGGGDSIWHCGDASPFACDL
jgi:hypothetical protein